MSIRVSYIVMANIVVAYIVMAYIVMAYTVMANIVMAVRMAIRVSIDTSTMCFGIYWDSALGVVSMAYTVSIA